MKRAAIITILFVLSAAGKAFSGEVTLEQCVNLALTSNSGLKSSEADTVAAREEASMALKDFLPSLRLLGTFTALDKSPRLIVSRNAFADGVPPTDAELPLGDKDFYSVALILKQPLFTGGILTGSYRRMREASEVSRLGYDARKKQLVYEVKKAFYEALNEQLAAETLEKALQAKKERLRVLKELSEEGYVGRDDVLRQETDTLFTELELLKSGNRGETALSRLKKLIHRDDSDAMTLAGSSFNAILIPSLQQVREAALARREELQSSRGRVRMAAADVTVARGGFFPQASVTGTYLRQKDTSITRPESWMLMATVDWPIFEWGKTINDVRRAAARKQQEEYRMDDTTREIAIEAEQAWRAVKEEEKSVAAHESGVRTSEYCLERDLEKYAHGRVKLAELLATEADFITAHNSYLTAVNSLNTALARLEATTATDVASWLVPQPVYRPDFEAYSRRSTELIRQRKSRNTPPPPATEAAANVTKPAKALVQPEPVPGPKSASGDSGSSAAIQVASLTSLNNAQEVQRKITAKAPGNKVHIISVGKFYKVRITGFRTSTEAENLAQRTGLRDYLIVRTDNGL